MNLLPVKASKLTCLTALGSLLLASQCFAYDTTNIGSGDFLNPATWSVLVPTNIADHGDLGDSWLITSNETVTIDSASPFYTGPVYFNYWTIGNSAVQNSLPEGTTTGTLIITNNAFVHSSEIPGDSYGLVGVDTNGGNFIMYGGTLDYDGPNCYTEAIVALPGNTYLTNTARYFWMTNLPQLQNNGNPNGWTVGLSGNQAPVTSVNGLEFEIGVNSKGSTNCIVALHNNAVLNIGNDVDFGDASGGIFTTQQSTALVMDGNSQFNIGSGIGFGRDYAFFTATLSDNATMTVGNSMGHGNTNGASNQGFLAIGSRIDHFSFWTLSGHAAIHSLMLKNGGYMNMLLTNYAQLLIYDVISPTGGTIVQPRSDSFIGYQDVSGNNTNSAMTANYNPYGLATLTVADHALFSVDSVGYYGVVGVVTNTANGAPTGASYSNIIGGLSIGNGAYGTSSNDIDGSGANGIGGQLIVKDYGTFRTPQNLNLGTSYVHHPGGPTVSNNVIGALVVEGPNCTNIIGQDLRLGITLLCEPVPPGSGIGRIDEIITAPTQSTIIVTNKAWLTNGTLTVELQGYTPVGSETYTLISAGIVDGLPLTNDFSKAQLLPGLVWNETTTSTQLILQVSNTFNIAQSGTNAIVTWSGTNGILQSSTSAATGYTDIVPTTLSPYTNSLADVAQYFRLRQNVTNILNQ